MENYVLRGEINGYKGLENQLKQTLYEQTVEKLIEISGIKTFDRKLYFDFISKARKEGFSDSLIILDKGILSLIEDGYFIKQFSYEMTPFIKIRIEMQQKSIEFSFPDFSTDENLEMSIWDFLREDEITKIRLLAAYKVKFDTEYSYQENCVKMVSKVTKK